eukprot:XP_015571007.1 uncharacterized protein LOC107260801 [Ricinus communis]
MVVREYGKIEFESEDRDNEEDKILILGDYNDDGIEELMRGDLLVARHRPWQFDRKAHYDGFLNKYSFVKDRRKVTLIPLSPKKVYDDQSKLVKERVNVKNAKHVIEPPKSGKDSGNQSSKKPKLKREFDDVFPEDMPISLPLEKGIEHQNDFVLRALILNRLAYRSNSEEINELQRQVDELMAKGYVRESLSLCVVPKKDGTWRMCLDCHAINKITIQMKTGDEWKIAFKTKSI